MNRKWKSKSLELVIPLQACCLFKVKSCVVSSVNLTLCILMLSQGSILQDYALFCLYILLYKKVVGDWMAAEIPGGSVITIYCLLSDL